jgi:ribonuclease BN (tRNA processing enzyme)
MLKRIPLCLVLVIGACASTPVDFQPVTVVTEPAHPADGTTVEPPTSPDDVGEPTVAATADATVLVMLGTGTPNPDPERSGPAVAIVAGGRPYLVDCGPGVVRRAAAAHLAGVSALDMPNLSRLFVTHLHSDHTAGYADFVLTPWVLDREEPVEVYGPPGIRSMTEHILAAYSEDIDIRLHGSQPQNETGIEVNAHEIEPGEIYKDENVTVTSFAVPHGTWRHAFGFRFDTADRSIVITGDTIATDAVVEACNGCDILVHEVYAKTGLDRRTADWQEYHRAAHTSGIELGEIAARARPKLLVLYHQLMWGATEAELLAEIRQSFDGPVVFADDLDVY